MQTEFKTMRHFNQICNQLFHKKTLPFSELTIIAYNHPIELKI